MALVNTTISSYSNNYTKCELTLNLFFPQDTVTFSHRSNTLLCGQSQKNPIFTMYFVVSISKCEQKF